MNIVLIAMFFALLIPVYTVGRGEGIWQKMLSLASVSIKASIMIVVISVLRDDWMLGVAGVISLSVGNASLMLLAHILKRLQGHQQ